MLSFTQSKAFFIAAAVASLSFSLYSFPVFGRQQNLSSQKVEALKKQTQCSFITGEGGAVNIRKGPGNKYPVVAKLKRGDGVRAVTRQGDWVKIVATFSGNPPNETLTILNGWVNNKFINGCSEDQFDRWRQ
ncbi:SH3 domain-containing protein [Tychonema sp. LEGE 07199]|uniref:SH3 domain-containing protein n=1 Tax=unclassified Tychonema TaxID=2642144 RepID=UPI00187FB27A|nr:MULTISPECIES: SH3 domain-containing protein [unclassified Tychonema]MBE9123685.1 SH3 domain-containing protein [Tychonema sp. LEGE 07199]MBE9135052.1 SH3 domain-containing protein [Tychonema sp. LEGE 07196]